MILVGSYALAAYIQGRAGLSPDEDYVGTFEETQSLAKGREFVSACYPIDSGKKFVIKKEIQPYVTEIEIAWGGDTASELIDLVVADKDSIEQCSGDLIPSLDVLYMLKMSHRYLRNSPHFLKTMRDIQAMRKLGAKIRPEHEEFYKRRQDATYWYAHPKLNVGKDDFFKDDGLVYTYDHDTIHLAMAEDGKEPAYESFRVPGSEVLCSKALFFTAPEHIRLRAVLEESMVLAIERSVVPHPHSWMTDKERFDLALMKVCTSITSGFFRTFAWENYDKVQSMYDPGYVSRFWTAVDNGIVKKL